MKKPLFNKICIVGVGLMGGSIGMAIKSRRLGCWVVGVVRRDENAKQAIRLNAVDAAMKSLKDGIRYADLVVLCTPISTIIKQLKVLDALILPKTLVIDVGSSKQAIEKVASKYLKNGIFVGCHPMAGSSKRGVDCGDADPNLFVGKTCFITTKNKKIKTFWTALGAIVNDKLPAKQHDEWVAGPSYAKHISDCALVRSKNMQRLLRFSLVADNPAFLDAARLSKCDPDLWADILLSNNFSLKHIQGLEKSVSDFRKALSSKNRKKIAALIRESNNISNKLAPNES